MTLLAWCRLVAKPGAERRGAWGNCHIATLSARDGVSASSDRSGCAFPPAGARPSPIPRRHPAVAGSAHDLPHAVVRCQGGRRGRWEVPSMGCVSNHLKSTASPTSLSLAEPASWEAWPERSALPSILAAPARACGRHVGSIFAAPAPAASPCESGLRSPKRRTTDRANSAIRQTESLGYTLMAEKGKPPCRWAPPSSDCLMAERCSPPSTSANSPGQTSARSRLLKT